MRLQAAIGITCAILALTAAVTLLTAHDPYLNWFLPWGFIGFVALCTAADAGEVGMRERYGAPGHPVAVFVGVWLLFVVAFPAYLMARPQTPRRRVA